MTHGGAPSPDAGTGPLDFAPDPAEFAALAKEHAIVPVWCEVVADTLTPVAAFANVVGDGRRASSSSRWRAASAGGATPSSDGARSPR